MGSSVSSGLYIYIYIYIYILYPNYLRQVQLHFACTLIRVYELSLLSLLCISDTSHLRQLVERLHNLNDWKTLGLHLIIPYWKLESIEIDHRRVADCKMAMLEHWLCTGVANKQALLLALRKMD